MADMAKHTADAIKRMRDKAPSHVGDVEVADEVPDEVTRAYIDAERAKARAKIFQSYVPELYKNATINDLEPVDQHREALSDWINSTSPTLLIVGRVGTGKTHAGYGILRDATYVGDHAFGCTLIDLLNLMKPGAAQSPIPRLATEAQLFMFDDVATERPTDWAVEQFGAIIDERTREGKRQIITSNATADQLREAYGSRIMSRLLGGATITAFTGEDLRKKHWG